MEGVRYRIINGIAILAEVTLPEGYELLVPEFYRRRGRENVEDFARILDQGLAGLTGPMDVKMKWDDKLGLTNMHLGIHSGFDLDLESRTFKEHNFTTKTSVISSTILIHYVNELLKSRRPT